MSVYLYLNEVLHPSSSHIERVAARSIQDWHEAARYTKSLDGTRMWPINAPVRIAPFDGGQPYPNTSAES
jgi:hypothetical protein